MNPYQAPRSPVADIPRSGLSQPSRVVRIIAAILNFPLALLGLLGLVNPHLSLLGLFNALLTAAALTNLACFALRLRPGVLALGIVLNFLTLVAIGVLLVFYPAFPEFFVAAIISSVPLAISAGLLLRAVRPATINVLEREP